MKKNMWLGITLSLSILSFFGVAGYVVYQGATQRDHICTQVHDLRNDIVRVLDLAAAEQRKRGIKPTQATQQARRIISQPSC